MIRKHSLAIIAAGCLAFSCSAPKFYKETARLLPEDDDTAIYTQGRDYSALVLKQLKAKLKDSRHIVYHYISPEAVTPAHPYHAVVYDMDNKKQYYILETNTGFITDGLPYTGAGYYKFVFDNYNDRNLAVLDQLGIMEDLKAYEAIFDINLSSKEEYLFTFKTFIPEDNQPETGVK
jgi:hypothetical protein